MYTCPSCQQKTIRFFRKWCANAASPAICSNCGQASAILIADAAGFVVAATVLSTLSGFAAVGLQSIWPLVVGLTSATGYYFWRQHTATLAVVTVEEKRAAKRSAWMEFLAVLFSSWLK